MATKAISYHYVKVLHPSNKGKAIYLELPKFIDKGDMQFIAGYEFKLDANGEPKLASKKGDIMHLMQLGEGVKIIGLEANKFYGNLEEKDKVEF